MKKSRSCVPLFLLLTGSSLCLGLAAAAFAVLILPEQATATFGPPAPDLDFVQRLRLSAWLLWKEENLTVPVDLFGSPRPFRVILGESILSISARLEAEGLIRDAGAFRDYLLYSGLDTTLQAGDYTLSPGMTSIEIARSMQDATPQEVTLTILEGWRREEIAATLPTSGLEITPEQFLKATRKPPPGYGVLDGLPKEATLEGLLFPGSYKLPRDLSVRELVDVLVSNFDAQVPLEVRNGFERQGLSLFESVTLASIVERETVIEDEMPLIASVFLNRLKIGMKLDADSTVQYALGYNEIQGTWWTNPLSKRDLQIDSPFNTYQYPGLPPGPIANPGLNALRAVAFPAQTPYYYFRVACDNSGRHAFSETFEEHAEKACP